MTLLFWKKFIVMFTIVLLAMAVFWGVLFIIVSVAAKFGPWSMPFIVATLIATVAGIMFACDKSTDNLFDK